MIRKCIVTALLIMATTGLIGCDYIGFKEFNKLKEQITLDSGITIDNLESKIMKFVFNVYSPQSEKDIQTGLESLKDLCSESEYISIVREVGQYNPDVEMSLSDVTIKYSNGKNNSDHMEHVYTEFKVSNGKITKEILIEFVINPNNKIFKHTLWQNSITDN